MKLYELYKLLGESGQLMSYTGKDCHTEKDFEEDVGYKDFKETGFKKIFNGDDEAIRYLHNNLGEYGNAFMHAFLLKPENGEKKGIVSLDRKVIVPIKYDEIKLYARYSSEEKSIADFIIAKKNNGIQLGEEKIPLYDLYNRLGEVIINDCMSIDIADTETKWGYDSESFDDMTIVRPKSQKTEIKRLAITKIYDLSDNKKTYECVDEKDFVNLQEKLIKNEITLDEQILYSICEHKVLKFDNKNVVITFFLDVNDILAPDEEMYDTIKAFQGLFGGHWKKLYNDITDSSKTQSLKKSAHYKDLVASVNELYIAGLYEAACDKLAYIMFDITNTYLTKKMGENEKDTIIGQFEYFFTKEENEYGNIANIIGSLNYELNRLGETDKYIESDVRYLYISANSLLDLFQEKFGTVEDK